MASYQFLPLLFLLLSTVLPSSLAAPSTGSISLFGDAGCTSPVFVSNYTIVADICGSPSSGKVKIFDGLYNSYIVDGRPQCANGTMASFALYTDTKCRKLHEEFGAGETFSNGFSVDGICLGMVAYLAVAFLCEGLPVGPVSMSVNTLPTVAPLYSATTASTEGASTSSALSVSATSTLVSGSSTPFSSSTSSSTTSITSNMSVLSPLSTSPGRIGSNATSPVTINQTTPATATATTTSFANAATDSLLDWTSELSLLVLVGTLLLA
ncbi:hypothetical protein MMC14_007591 [Varicellaria rhodocarpa]|nr:hypothetical protein [Varicellaria rhodocarpa]